MITGGSYVADSWSESPYNKEYLQNGFITAYAQHSDTEDFAEMLSEYITHSEAWWAEQITNAGEKGRLINAKLDVVRKYMKDSFNIDLDQLRATVLRRQKDVFDGQVDLHSVKIQ
jgi:substrate import-associated zinc metallohydrolase lipoprotein